MIAVLFMLFATLVASIMIALAVVITQRLHADGSYVHTNEERYGLAGWRMIYLVFLLKVYRSDNSLTRILARFLILFELLAIFTIGGAFYFTS